MAATNLANKLKTTLNIVNLMDKTSVSYASRIEFLKAIKNYVNDLVRETDDLILEELLKQARHEED